MMHNNRIIYYWIFVNGALAQPELSRAAFQGSNIKYNLGADQHLNTLVEPEEG